MPLTFTTEESSDGAVSLRLSGSLDAMTAPELLPTIDRLVEEKRTRVSVHLEGLDLIDSSGVAAIVALYKRTRSNGGRVTVTGARDQPLAIFKLLRMDRVFAL
ncbi:MAG TPA: STAS domain-containing protein [Kofleriaceae bacterium]|nr:STAS domain-containing protein [Kofleriaceae bacterium]